MKDKNKITKNILMNEVIKNRRGKVDLKYFSANKKRNNNIQVSPNIELNKINIRELSKLADRPIKCRGDNNYNFFSLDRTNKRFDKNNNMNNIRRENNIINLNNNYNYNYNNYNSGSKKNIVIFTEPPKKLSDYILKEKSNIKKKVYKMIFIEERDFQSIKSPYINDYNNTENSISIKNDEIKSNNYKLESKSRYNNIFLNNRTDYNNNRRKRLFVNLKENNQRKMNKAHIIKIQSLWRGFFARKIFFRNIKIISGSKIFKILYKIIYNTRKNYIKIFLAKMQKNYNNSSQKNPFYDRKKLNKNNRIYVNKYQNKKNIKNSYNNYIYKRKNKSPGNYLSFNKKKENNIPVHNIRTIPKKEINNNYGIDILKNANYKKVIETEILKLIKYINKRAIFLHFPTLLYRLKILHKIKIVEQRYKSLYRIIKIKEKSKLYLYLQKYKNIIFSESMNKEKNINNNINNYNTKRIKINTRQKYLQKKNSLNLTQKRISLLTTILTKTELKNKNKSLKKYFYKWKSIISKKIIIVQDLKNKNENSDKITKYYSASLPKKKQIKFKRMKSNYNSINSKLFSKSLTKKFYNNSFYSDNVNIKKMKVRKINVFVEPNDIKKEGSKELQLIKKMSNSDNSFFINKVASITNKISNKVNLYNCFKYWKRESKKNK